MSEILNKLKELVNYYNVNRGVGHTTRMLMGATNTKYAAGEVIHDTHTAIILTHNSESAGVLNTKLDYFNGFRKNIKAIPFSSNYDTVLRGHHYPILLDNCLLQQLFQEAATEIETLSTDANRYKQDNITLEHFNKKLTDDLAISLSIQYKLDERIEKLEAEKKELIDTLVKVKNELLTYRENESDKDTSQTINRELLTSVRELNEKIDSERRVVDLVGEYKTSQKSFLSPLVDMLIENREVKSIEVKIEYKE
jgi:hypothetical protein